MTQRKYSVDEIDAMRFYIISWHYCQSYWPQEPHLSAQVENELRTYMMNGTDPKELHDRWEKAQQEFEARNRD